MVIFQCSAQVLFSLMFSRSHLKNTSEAELLPASLSLTVSVLLVHLLHQIEPQLCSKSLEHC